MISRQGENTEKRNRGDAEFTEVAEKKEYGKSLLRYFPSFLLRFLCVSVVNLICLSVFAFQEEVEPVRVGEDGEFTLPKGETQVVFVSECKGYARVIQVDAASVTGRGEGRLIDPGGEDRGDLRFRWEQKDLVSAVRVNPGTHRLILRGVAVEAPLRFRIELMEEIDPWEPDDKWEDAREVVSGDPFSMTIFPHSDEDWVRLLVPRKGILVCRQPDAQEAGIRISFHLANDAGEAVATPPVQWDGYDLWTAVPVGPGLWYVRITSDYGSREPVEAVIDLDEEWDPMEPNDDPDAAPEVRGPMRIRSFPYGDEDWFRARLEHAGRVRVVQEGGVASAIKVNPAVRVEGREDLYPFRMRFGRRELGESPRDLVGTVDLPEGDHRIRLTGNGYGREVLRVRLEVLPQDDLFEPNDDPSQARVILPGEPFRLRLPPGDEDWFSVTPPGPGYLAFRTKGNPFPAAPRISLHRGGELQPLEWPERAETVGDPVLRYRRVIRVSGEEAVLFRVTDAENLGSAFVMEVVFQAEKVAVDGSRVVVGWGTDEAFSTEGEAFAGTIGAVWLRFAGDEDEGVIDLRPMDPKALFPEPVVRKDEEPSEPSASVGFDPLWIGVGLAGLGILLLLVRKARGGRHK